MKLDLSMYKDGYRNIAIQIKELETIDDNEAEIKKLEEVIAENRAKIKEQNQPNVIHDFTENIQPIEYHRNEPYDTEIAKAQNRIIELQKKIEENKQQQNNNKMTQRQLKSYMDTVRANVERAYNEEKQELEEEWQKSDQKKQYDSKMEIMSIIQSKDIKTPEQRTAMMKFSKEIAELKQEYLEKAQKLGGEYQQFLQDLNDIDNEYGINELESKLEPELDVEPEAEPKKEPDVEPETEPKTELSPEEIKQHIEVARKGAEKLYAQERKQLEEEWNARDQENTRLKHEQLGKAERLNEEYLKFLGNLDNVEKQYGLNQSEKPPVIPPKTPSKTPSKTPPETPPKTPPETPPGPKKEIKVDEKFSYEFSAKGIKYDGIKINPRKLLERYEVPKRQEKIEQKIREALSDKENVDEFLDCSDKFIYLSIACCNMQKVKGVDEAQARDIVKQRIRDYYDIWNNPQGKEESNMSITYDFKKLSAVSMFFRPDKDDEYYAEVKNAKDNALEQRKRSNIEIKNNDLWKAIKNGFSNLTTSLRKVMLLDELEDAEEYELEDVVEEEEESAKSFRQSFKLAKEKLVEKPKQRITKIKNRISKKGKYETIKSSKTKKGKYEEKQSNKTDETSKKDRSEGR